MNKLLKKCPSCGAVIEHNFNHKCPYCRQELHITDEDVKKIKNYDIKIQKVNIEQLFVEASFIIQIVGTNTPKFYNYEETYNDYVYFSEPYTPYKIGYNIKIPIIDLYEIKTVSNLIHYVLDSIPPEFSNSYNENKIIESIISNNQIKRYLEEG